MIAPVCVKPIFKEKLNSMQAMQGIQSYEQVMIMIVLATAFIALIYAYWLARQTFAAEKGSEAMQRIWGFIRDGGAQ